MNRRAVTADVSPGAVRTGWLAWFTWLVIGGALLFEDWKIGGAGFNLVLTAPFWLLWVFWPLWRGWQGLRRRGLAGPVADWRGECLHFEDEPLRLIADAGQVWVVAGDVWDLLGVTSDERPAPLNRLAGFPGEVILEENLQSWLAARNDDRALRLREWLAQEAARLRREEASP